MLAYNVLEQANQQGFLFRLEMAEKLAIVLVGKLSQDWHQLLTRRREFNRTHHHPLLRADTTINGQRVAGDVTGFVGYQPHHGVGDLVWLADPPHRHEGDVADALGVHHILENDDPGAGRQQGLTHCRGRL